MNFDLNLASASPGIALAVLGYFGFIFKDIPSQIWSLIKQKYSISIQVSSQDDNLFCWTLDWLIEKFPELKKHVQYGGYSSLQTFIANGLYMFMLDPLTYAVVSKNKESGTMNQVTWTVTCEIVGKNRIRYLDQYKEAINQRLPNANEYLKVNFVGHDRYTELIYSHKKVFDDVFIKEEIKSKIMQIINNFLESREYYDAHGITYKLGICLSGEPGGGKTILAKAIASYIGWDVRYITAGDPLPSSLTNTIIMLEDIDCIVDSSRENNNSLVGSKRKNGRIPSFKELQQAEAEGTLDQWNNVKPKLSIHDLLNYLDGMKSPSSCIFIATTNYPDKLDPALIRPGRFDYHFHIDYADKELAKEMCDRFEVGYEILDEFEFPCSLALIQNKIMFGKINKEK